MTALHITSSAVSWAGAVLESDETARACRLNEEAIRRADVIVLFGLGQGRLARRVASYGRRLLVFEPVVDLARDSYVPAGARLIPSAPALRHELIAQADERVVLIASDEYHRAFGTQFTAVADLIRECELLKKIRRNTRARRYDANILNGAENTEHLSRATLWTDHRLPLSGRPAVIVSAGPSLDRNRHLIPEFRARGAAIFAVNTSLPIVAEEGGADVTVCVEAIDSSDALRPHVARAGLLALDLGSHPRHFGLGRSTVIFPAVEPFVQLASSLGSAPLPYGGSVATAAFALAAVWGADPLILLGQDLAYTGGRAYAAGLGTRSEIRVQDAIDHLRFEYPPAHLARFEAAGAPVPSARQVKVTLPAWGGQGAVHATPDLLLFLRWFEAQAPMLRGRRLYNATEGGATIEGFGDLAASEVLRMLPARAALGPIEAPVRFTGAQVRHLRRVLRDRTVAIRAAAASRDLPRLRAAIAGSAFVDSLAGPNVMPLTGREPDFADLLCVAVDTACSALLPRL